MLATYMRRMRKSNLEIRIVGSSCRPDYGVRSLENEECSEKKKKKNAKKKKQNNKT